jgi:TPR repeat protein
MLSLGKCTERNMSESVKKIKQSASENNIKGMLNLGLLYADGVGVEQSYSEAAN